MLARLERVLTKAPFLIPEEIVLRVNSLLSRNPSLLSLKRLLPDSRIYREMKIHVTKYSTLLQKTKWKNQCTVRFKLSDWEMKKPRNRKWRRRSNHLFEIKGDRVCLLQSLNLSSPI